MMPFGSVGQPTPSRPRRSVPSSRAPRRQRTARAARRRTGWPGSRGGRRSPSPRRRPCPRELAARPRAQGDEPQPLHAAGCAARTGRACRAAGRREQPPEHADDEYRDGHCRPAAANSSSVMSGSSASRCRCGRAPPMRRQRVPTRWPSPRCARCPSCRWTAAGRTAWSQKRLRAADAAVPASMGSWCVVPLHRRAGVVGRGPCSRACRGTSRARPRRRNSRRTGRARRTDGGSSGLDGLPKKDFGRRARRVPAACEVMNCARTAVITIGSAGNPDVDDRLVLHDVGHRHGAGRVRFAPGMRRRPRRSERDDRCALRPLLSMVRLSCPAMVP